MTRTKIERKLLHKTRHIKSMLTAEFQYVFPKTDINYFNQLK